MIAEIISVGTEILLGEIVDTNAAFLAGELKRLGVNVYRKTTVGDNLERIKSALADALERSELIVMTGGLGPTDDDLTREAISELLDEWPELDDNQFDLLTEWFKRRGLLMPEANRKQAWRIASSELLANPYGTAPGWFVRVPKPGQSHRSKEHRAVIVAMPGPPHEMQPMWREQVLSRLRIPAATLYTRTFRTFGIGESQAAEDLGELLGGANPSVATYARRDGVHVRLAARADKRSEAEVLAREAEANILKLLGEYIYGIDDETLPMVIGKLLSETKETVATLESVTGGLVCDELTNAPGSSAWLHGGAVVYSGEAKKRFGVDSFTIEEYGQVSTQVALEMAKNACREFGTDWGLATTGVAGPATTENQPVGRVCIAVIGPKIARFKELQLVGERRAIKERAALSVLGLLWDSLKSSRGNTKNETEASTKTSTKPPVTGTTTKPKEHITVKIETTKKSTKPTTKPTKGRA